VTFLQACRCRKRRHGFKDAACPIGWSINASAKRKRKSRILRIDQRVALAFFALDRVGATWYGFETAIQLRLLFDASGALAEREFREVHTFL